MADSLKLPPLKAAALLQAHGLRPDKRLGQNFLVDEHALERIAAAAEITPQDGVLEIGPGMGALTRHLALRAARVVAVELDRRLLPILEQVVAAYDNVQVVQGDILQQDPAALMGENPYLVVANIPYYITSAVFRHLLHAGRQPERIVLTIQREVAERICAQAGKMSLLALSVQVYGAPKVVARIPAGAFYPAPRVDSAVVRVDLYPQPRIPRPLLDDFFRVAKAAFSQKRKTLLNALSGGMRWGKAETRERLLRAEISPQARAQELDWEAWERLLQTLSGEPGAGDDIPT